MCHSCGFSVEEKPARCPKCANSTFERIGAAAAVEEAGRVAEGTPELVRSARQGGPKERRSSMGAFQCVDGCGRKVSKAGGRCRTCAGLLRQKKPRAGPAAKKHPAPGGQTKTPPTGEGVGGVAEVLRAAGYHVMDATIVEATVQVRLGAPASTSGGAPPRSHEEGQG
jgi:hypothetical protein